MSITTVNEETFQVYYFDENVVKVYVDGEIKRISDAEFAFVPDAELLPGVQYIAQVWGENDASGYSHADWVQDISGGPLEEGRLWTFWTLPDIQVTVKPVQVLEGMALIAHKPTVIRTFIRWDLQPGVFRHSQLPNVEVDDIKLVWIAMESMDSGGGAWSNGTQWEPARTPKTALRKREYRELTFAEESYTNSEKWEVLDSVNYYGFTPPVAGGYQITVRVLVNDSRGRAHPFVGQVSMNATVVRDFHVDMRAIAVGADYGKTGVVDLSAPIDASLNRLRAIYPIAKLHGPATPSAMQYYTPTTTLWLFDWKTEPGGRFPKKYLLQEMSALCQRTTGCRAMIGLTSPAWLVDQGLTLPGVPWGAFIKNDCFGSSTFVAAHEVGHLARFEHIEEPAGEGFDVRRHIDRRYSVEHDVFDFMTIDPVESLGNQLWISNWHYVSLALWTGATPLQATNAPLAVSSSDPLLLVSGVMTESTGATVLLPWYQMAPGEWQPPETGPYSLVFLDTANQELGAYTRAFTVSATLQPAGAAPVTDDPAFFNFVTPYPAAAAKVQIRRAADNAVLAEVIPSATAPTVSIDPPGSNTWTGAQPLTWQGGAGAHYFAVDVSTDGGTNWEALAINLTGESYTLQTVALPNTTQALVRVAATDGFRTSTATAGPFTITNPPLVGYVSPIPGATGVGIRESIYAGFRDPMDAADPHQQHLHAIGGAVRERPRRCDLQYCDPRGRPSRPSSPWPMPRATQRP